VKETAVARISLVSLSQRVALLRPDSDSTIGTDCGELVGRSSCLREEGEMVLSGITWDLIPQARAQCVAPRGKYNWGKGSGN
jgi:hypothetical protein